LFTQCHNSFLSSGPSQPIVKSVPILHFFSASRKGQWTFPFWRPQRQDRRQDPSISGNCRLPRPYFPESFLCSRCYPTTFQVYSLPLPLHPAGDCGLSTVSFPVSSCHTT